MQGTSHISCKKRVNEQSMIQQNSTYSVKKKNQSLLFGTKGRINNKKMTLSIYRDVI